MRLRPWKCLVRIKELLLASPSSSSDIKRLSDVSVRSHSDICYAPMLSAVHDARVTLDAYQLVSSPAKGTVIFLHGGGLRKGSKRHIAGKDLFFNSLGFNFLSCNYPLVAQCTDSVIDEQLLALKSLDQWVKTELQLLCPVNDNAPIVYFGHSAGSYLIALGLSKGLFLNQHSSFILIDSAAYDLSKRYSAARPNIKQEIERLVGYRTNDRNDLESLIRTFSPVDNMASMQVDLTRINGGWAYLATTMKRFSRESSVVLASLLRQKLKMEATVKSYPFGHTDISREIADPNSQIGRDLTILLSKALDADAPSAVDKTH
jgi:hypothetical protein